MRQVVTLAATFGLLGCAATVTRDHVITTMVAPHATVDLACPADKISYTDRGTLLTIVRENNKDVGISGSGMTDKLEVSGCNKNATYVYDSRQGWVPQSSDAKPSGGN